LRQDLDDKDAEFERDFTKQRMSRPEWLKQVNIKS
jgi:hypothetical protein